jgi:hypothetical protein
MTEVHFRNFEEHLLAMGLAEAVPFPKAEKTERSAKEAPLARPCPGAEEPSMEAL